MHTDITLACTPKHKQLLCSTPKQDHLCWLLEVEGLKVVGQLLAQPQPAPAVATFATAARVAKQLQPRRGRHVRLCVRHLADLVLRQLLLLLHGRCCSSAALLAGALLVLLLLLLAAPVLVVQRFQQVWLVRGIAKLHNTPLRRLRAGPPQAAVKRAVCSRQPLACSAESQPSAAAGCPAPRHAAAHLCGAVVVAVVAVAVAAPAALPLLLLRLHLLQCRLYALVMAQVELHQRHDVVCFCSSHGLGGCGSSSSAQQSLMQHAMSRAATRCQQAMQKQPRVSSQQARTCRLALQLL